MGSTLIIQRILVQDGPYPVQEVQHFRVVFLASSGSAREIHMGRVKETSEPRLTDEPLNTSFFVTKSSATLDDLRSRNWVLRSVPRCMPAEGYAATYPLSSQV